MCTETEEKKHTPQSAIKGPDMKNQQNSEKYRLNSQQNYLRNENMFRVAQIFVFDVFDRNEQTTTIEG